MSKQNEDYSGTNEGRSKMSLEEQKQVAIDYYINLMRIKSEETAVNKELDRQIQIARIKLSTFAVDLSEIDKLF